MTLSYSEYDALISLFESYKTPAFLPSLDEIAMFKSSRKILLDGFVLLSIYQNLARHRLLIQSTIKHSYFHNFCMLISICLMMTLQRMLPLSFLKGVFLL